MKNNICNLFIFISLNCFGQNQVVFSEKFNDNINAWEINESFNTLISGGLYSIQTNSVDDQFSSLPLKLLDKIKPNLQGYELAFSIKINSIENNAGIVGVRLIDTIIDNQIKNGYEFFIEFVRNKYYLLCRNIDESTPFIFYEIPDFKLDNLYKIKIKVNNLIPQIVVNIDEKLAFNINRPLFNISNLCIFSYGKIKYAFDQIEFKQSVGKENNKFCYDIIDLYNDQSSSTLHRGRYGYDQLVKHVPYYLLTDDLFFQFETELNIKSVIDEIMKDENCYISKSNYTSISEPLLKYYTIEYKGNTIVISYSKETEKMVGMVVTFKTNNLATDFFTSYVSLKKFKVRTEEDGTQYAMNMNFFLSYVSLGNKTVTFFFAGG